MSSPLTGFPSEVSLRVLKLSRAPYYRWRTQQVTRTELVKAYRANALYDAHRDDPEFGYRFLVAEAAQAGEVMCERRSVADLPGQPVVLRVRSQAR